LAEPEKPEKCVPMALIDGASCFLLQIIVQCLPLKRLSNEMDLAESDVKRKKVAFKRDDPRFFFSNFADPFLCEEVLFLPVQSHAKFGIG
jgi:hypothetical protein